MKSFTVMAIALLGLTNAATIRICKDQTLGNCVTMDVGSCSTFLILANPQASSTSRLLFLFQSSKANNPS